MSVERSKKEVVMRLRRIEGQVRGLQRMIEEEVPCPEILTQVAAVTAAIKKVGAIIVQTYMSECLEKSEAAASKGTDNLKDFHKALSRYMDWA